MKAILSMVAAVLVLASAGTGMALAASPAPSEVPTVGGTLSAEGHSISVYSNGNVPATVHMEAEAVVLSETDFPIAPGETHTLTFSGPKATGNVKATYTTVAQYANGESGSAELVLALTPGHVPPPPFDWAPFGLAGLGIVAFLLLLRRARPWRYRLVRAA